MSSYHTPSAISGLSKGKYDRPDNHSVTIRNVYRYTDKKHHFFVDQPINVEQLFIHRNTA